MPLTHNFHNRTVVYYETLSNINIFVYKGFHAIPCLTEQLDGHSLLNTETLWILSTILPPCFLGIVAQASSSREHQTAVADERNPLGKVGLLFYLIACLSSSFDSLRSDWVSGLSAESGCIKWSLS